MNVPAAPGRLAVGAVSPEYRVGPVSRTDIVRYAGAGGDFNPIHHDDLLAREAGNPSVFAHGLLQVGTLSHLVCDWLGLAHLRSYSVRFVDRVWPGDVLLLRGTVTDVTGEGEDELVECAFSMICESDGRTVVSATAAAVFPACG